MYFKQWNFWDFLGKINWPLKLQLPYCILSCGRFLPLNHLKNSNFVWPNPSIGSNFLEELRKLRFLWSKLLLRTRLELDSSSTFKTRIGLRLTHHYLYLKFIIQHVRLYDYECFWKWIFLPNYCRLFHSLRIHFIPMFYKIDFYAKLY